MKHRVEIKEILSYKSKLTGGKIKLLFVNGVRAHLACVKTTSPAFKVMCAVTGNILPPKTSCFRVQKALQGYGIYYISSSEIFPGDVYVAPETSSSKIAYVLDERAISNQSKKVLEGYVLEYNSSCREEADVKNQLQKATKRTSDISKKILRLEEVIEILSEK